MALETLKKRSDFLAAQKNGRKWVSRGLIVQAIPNSFNTIRVGYTVSKKVDKRAVVRNRIKRRLRAVAAQVLTEFASDSFDYVLIGRELTASRPYETLCKDLQWCLRKMGHARQTQDVSSEGSS